MKVAFFKLEPLEKNYIKNHESMAGHELLFFDHILSKDDIPDNISFEVASVFVDSIIDSEVISKLPNLKMIATRSTGYDHIDMETAKKNGIVVTNVPAYGENTVAEFTFALLLTLSRKIFESHHRIKEEGSFNLNGLRGFDLKGKILGVVGTGRIGVHVIKIAKGFDMKVIANDTFPNKDLAKEMGFEYVSLEEVLEKSDVITLHVPYIKETHHLINKNNTKLIKKGAYLINTSRGSIVETEALVGALKNGNLAGAGLDVLEEEGAIKDELNFLTQGHPEEHNLKTILADHVLIDMPNVVITPHNAFNTFEALQRILNTTLWNISSFAKSEVVNIVK
ncbi:MAG: NAD(P)-dependent oxidoreductase [Patescibacteria group bacterium]